MTHKETLDALRQPVRALREHIPAVFEGYGALTGAVFAIRPSSNPPSAR
jgi:hypothetical protein